LQFTDVPLQVCCGKTFYHDLHAVVLAIWFIHFIFPLFTSVTGDEEHQVLLASNREVMKQLVGCLQTKIFNTYWIYSNIALCLQNLSSNPCTHQYFFTSEIVFAMVNFSADKILPTSFIEGVDPAQCLKLVNDTVK
jgi:hypothetical protein